MSREFRPGWVVAFVVAGLVGAALFLRTTEELQPELVAAYVAIQPQGESLARTGELRLAAGTDFRLHAVVEAVDWRGRKLYFSEAESLELEGTPVAAGSLRRWDQRGRVRVMWFTVEGSPPFIEVNSLEDLERLRYREVFQADWPQAWSVPGRIDPTVENFLPDRDSRSVVSRFGTQRFQVRVEVFGSGESLLPSVRLRSVGAADLEASPAGFPTVVAELRPPLRSVSRVFGLPQLEFGTEADSAWLDGRLQNRLAFSRLGVLRSWLEETAMRWEDLEWRSVELNGSREWARGAAIRAGSKVAFSYQDLGTKGRLDQEDLSLDFDKGATVRTLEEIFVGEGLVEIALVDDRPTEE